jgi:hypothetical protein
MSQQRSAALQYPQQLPNEFGASKLGPSVSKQSNISNIAAAGHGRVPRSDGSAVVAIKTLAGPPITFCHIPPTAAALLRSSRMQRLQSSWKQKLCMNQELDDYDKGDRDHYGECIRKVTRRGTRKKR